MIDQGGRYFLIARGANKMLMSSENENIQKC